ncbi:MAG: 2Fe-2S iron-sulfur cluster binding domain-containing protein [Planctomycetes bacterium]|nr:2Fe-2S iron-sulfur cluster binding domain-containing protein [Planctomycetota bacterium]
MPGSVGAFGPLEIVGLVVVIAVLYTIAVNLITTWRSAMGAGSAHRRAMEQWHARVEQAKLKRAEAEKPEEGWAGFRKFKIGKKIPETKDLCSFYLVPHDNKPLPEFKPGQFLTFRLNIPGQPKPVMRCYSLSDAPRPDYYRVTIKRAPGLSSCFFHDVLKQGDILDVRAPGGDFFLDMNKDRPVVLLGGGIGLTPVLSMLNEITKRGMKLETWFFYGMKNGTEHAQKKHIETVAAANPNVKLNICYSQPDPAKDAQGRDYQHASRVTVDLLRKLLPSSNYDYYLCGPPPFMESLVTGLQKWGVPDENVHFEAFGPATVKKKEAASGAPKGTGKVTFAKSGKTIEWSGKETCILDFGEANGLKLNCGCRAGNCGECAVAIQGGEVEYGKSPSFKCDKGTVLTCLSVPKGDCTIDA